QRAKIALLVPAVAIGILQRTLHRLLGDADRVLAAAVEALGGFQDLLVLGVGGYAPLHACHDETPSFLKPLETIGHEGLHDLRVGIGKHHRAARVADELVGTLDHAMALAGGLHLDPAGGGHLEPLLGGRFCLQLGHFASPYGRFSACSLAGPRPGSIRSRHGMPCRAARKTRPYSGSAAKAQPSASRRARRAPAAPGLRPIYRGASTIII